MIKKSCPICETRDYSKTIYLEKLPKNPEDANFAGRKDPDGYHYKMLRCAKCSLLYASEIYEEDHSNKLYNESTFEYSDELKGLTKSYSKILQKGLTFLDNNKDNFLEIGCGNGFMLEEAIKMGFKNVKGIEPSKEAISFAREDIKNNIHHGIFDSSQIKEKLYDVVFIAMIIEHVVDANSFLDNIYKTLKPGGVIICICHNERHFLAKILKSRHPIINDEHAAVFNKEALRLIFKKNKYENIKVENLKNFYSINYWIKMIPKSVLIKKISNNSFFSFLGKVIIGLKAGNLYLIAKKNK